MPTIAGHGSAPKSKDEAATEAAYRQGSPQDDGAPDPSERPFDWEDFRDRDREFYRLCIESLFERSDLMVRALIDSGHDVVDRSAVHRK